MLSRVANAVYWMCRYVERAENVARFIGVNLNLFLDMPIAAVDQWKPMIATTGDQNLFEERYDSYSQENVIHFLTFDKVYQNSIISCGFIFSQNCFSTLTQYLYSLSRFIFNS